MSMTSEMSSEAAVAAAEPAMVQSVSLPALRNLLQDAGFRAAELTDGNVTFLRSASNGLAFDVRLGNRLVVDGEDYADFVFVALFEVRGGFPLELLNQWNKAQRFGRLFLDRVAPDTEFLVLSYDVSVVGGVSQRALWSQLSIWDRLVQQLIPWLREELSKVASSVNGAAAPEAPAVVSDNA